MPYKTIAKRRRWQRQYMRAFRRSRAAQQGACAAVAPAHGAVQPGATQPASAGVRTVAQTPARPKPPVAVQQPQTAVQLSQLSPLTREAYKLFREWEYDGDVRTWIEEMAVWVLKQKGYEPSAALATRPARLVKW